MQRAGSGIKNERCNQSNVGMKTFSELVVHEHVSGEEGTEFFLQDQNRFCLITVVGEDSYTWERAFTSAKPNSFSLKAVSVPQFPPL